MPADRWSRPASVPVPRVWRRACGRQPVDGKLPRFVIQDVPDELHDAVVDFMSTHFPKDETICMATRLWLDPVSMEELRGLWRQTLNQHVAVVALLEEEGGNKRIVGCNLLGVLYKADRHAPNPYKGDGMRKFLDALNYPSSITDPYDHFGVDEAIVGLGLSIDPAFRGQGLGLEIMRARFDLGKAVGLKATYTVFTAIQSQSLAAKVGMETLAEVLYKDYKENGKVIFEVSFPPSMKLMGKSIE